MRRWKHHLYIYTRAQRARTYARARTRKGEGTCLAARNNWDSPQQSQLRYFTFAEQCYSLAIAMRDQANIPLRKAQYQRFLAVKAEVEQESGRPITWAEFLDRLFQLYAESKGHLVEMHQEPGGHEASRGEAAFDEPMTLEVGAALGHPVYLSDETCERIAESLAAKLRPAHAAVGPSTRNPRKRKTAKRGRKA